ncbi:hypothetical protein KAE78_00730 [Microbacterium sp. NIBRBAC000506063]|nr:hypothetical protein KAE78_00730 [Microbacterium sp. NIBRBAC000506063]
MNASRRTLALLAVGLLALSSCASEPANPVATFEVAGSETFKVELVTPELVEHAERLLAGDDVAAIPNGIVVRGEASVNEPWSWHIDPRSSSSRARRPRSATGSPPS